MGKWFSTVAQPGDVLLHLSLAGAWGRAFRQTLSLGRTADHRLVPETFAAAGAAMSAVLAYYLALEHAREVEHRAPWLDRTLMQPDTLDELYRIAAEFRDAYMHFGDKAAREYDFQPAPPTPPGRLPAPGGAVTMAFGFEESGPYLYAPSGPVARRRSWTRLAWADMSSVIDDIEAWLLDLLDRWPDVQDLWAPYVTERGHKLP